MTLQAGCSTGCGRFLAQTVDVSTLPLVSEGSVAPPRGRPAHGGRGSRGTFAASAGARRTANRSARTAGARSCYECRRPNGSLRYRCKACRKDFSLTSGTLFAFHKLPLQTYLAAIAIFCNEVKGKSALALSRDLGVQYKTAFVLSHKLREAMASEMKASRLAAKASRSRSMAATSADT